MKTLKKIFALIALSILTMNIAFAQTEPRVIEIKGTDNLKFDVTTIEAAPGESLKIIFTVVSRIPKQAMAHNVVILEKGIDVKAFANASAKARDNEYIAAELQDQIVANTGLAGGGETVEVTFTVPKAPGDYEYICSFPGHYYGGMKGVLTVK